MKIVKVNQNLLMDDHGIRCYDEMNVNRLMIDKPINLHAIGLFGPMYCEAYFDINVTVVHNTSTQIIILEHAVFSVAADCGKHIIVKFNSPILLLPNWNDNFIEENAYKIIVQIRGPRTEGILMANAIDGNLENKTEFEGINFRIQRQSGHLAELHFDTCKEISPTKKDGARSEKSDSLPKEAESTKRASDSVEFNVSCKAPKIEPTNSPNDSLTCSTKPSMQQIPDKNETLNSEESESNESNTEYESAQEDDI